MQELKDYIARHADRIGEKGFYQELGEKFGVSAENARWHCRQHKSANAVSDDGIITYRTHKYPNLEDVLRESNVDTSKYEVSKYVINSWEVGTFLDGEPLKQPLYQIKIWLKQIKGHLVSLVDDFKEDLKKGSPSPKKITYAKKTAPLTLEISLTDLHIGKACVDGENSEDFIIDAIEHFISRAPLDRVERIIFPIGNDATNFDNFHGTTTRGTPQDNSMMYREMFRRARMAYVVGIDRLRKIAPVDVPVVVGNHDEQTAFCLGDALECWYHNDPNVTIDNSDSNRKYVQFGENLILLTHGNEEKHNDLPLIMATEQPEMWSRSKYREVHLGHYHRSKQTKFTDLQEHTGVRVRILPSLSYNDEWHHKKGYIGMRESQMLVWGRGVEELISYKP